MFEAVIMGWSHPRLSPLSNRRAIRRLACRKRFDILCFTRNPPCFVEWVCSTCPLYPRKQGWFRVFSSNQRERFACLGPSTIQEMIKVAQYDKNPRVRERAVFALAATE